MSKNLMEDPRFAAMFDNSDFAIDKESDQYKLLHPTQNPKKQRHLAESDEETRSDRGGDSDSDDSGSEDEQWIKTHKKGHKEVRNPDRHKRELERMEDEKITDDVMSRDNTMMFVPRQNDFATKKEKISLDTRKDLEKFGSKRRWDEIERQKESTMEEKLQNMATEGRPEKIRNVNGGKVAVFHTGQEMKKNMKEKKKLIRSAEHLFTKQRRGPYKK